MKNIIFCDIDGTIIDGSRGMMSISEKTKYAVEQLKKDNYFFIASGRCKALLPKEIIDLNPCGYVLCNGAYTELDGKEISSDYLSKQVVDKVRKLVDKYEGFYIFETLDGLYINSVETAAFKYFAQFWGSALSEFEAKDYEEKKFNIAMIGFLSDEICKEVYDELSGIANAIRHNASNSFDINSLGMNKGVGVKKVAEYLNVDMSNTYCFGDGLNDLEMLQVVGHPVIMSNAESSLKEYGFEQTCDVLEDGFYNYLVANKLIKEL